MTNESKMTIAKNKKLESDLKNEKSENERLRRQLAENREFRQQVQIGRMEANGELEEMRKRLGAKGGIGHFWENDRQISEGGVRYTMKKEELKKVARAISLGQKEINLKEREFLAFFEKGKQKQPREVLVER